MVVHAAGAVQRPGVYVMTAGARAADVVFAAGGLAGDADADRVNLAVTITDGSRLYIPRKGIEVPLVPVEQISGGSPSGSGSTAGDTTGKSATSPINLNTATSEQLDSLPGVGPSTAASIIEYRAKIGRYKSVSQLLDVPGIGEAKLAAMRKRLIVG
jgi:competence protein ComEA